MSISKSRDGTAWLVGASVYLVLSLAPYAADLSSMSCVLSQCDNKKKCEGPEFDVPSIPFSPTTISRLYTLTVEGFLHRRSSHAATFVKRKAVPEQVRLHYVYRLGVPGNQTPSRLRH
jgi:hypothetical protein